jgi:hypothetical protein
MSEANEHKQAVEDYLGVDDYREFWKAVKEDLHSRVITEKE